MTNDFCVHVAIIQCRIVCFAEIESNKKFIPFNRSYSVKIKIVDLLDLSKSLLGGGGFQ
jgi:hypothetical protein